MEHLRRQGDPFRDEELARLPPLGWQHINLRGRCVFTSSPPGGLPPTDPPIPARSSEPLHEGNRQVRTG
ncbi:Tn3 family transposase [Actinopolyspora saharensis]|uniref:Tn3 family transposase n=1 Tax=Actinopolyspora saharensis TaxID=995062 RepID=UPI0011139A6A